MNRAEAIEHLKNMRMPHDKFYEEISETSKALIDKGNEALDMAIETLENPKTGHWIWESRVISETYTDPEEIEYIGWVCDNCYNPPNDYAEWDNPEEKPMYKYCPNCGAKMEGE